jgi:hypothetical protein
MSISVVRHFQQKSMNKRVIIFPYDRRIFIYTHTYLILTDYLLDYNNILSIIISIDKEFNHHLCLYDSHKFTKRARGNILYINGIERIESTHIITYWCLIGDIKNEEKIIIKKLLNLLYFILCSAKKLRILSFWYSLYIVLDNPWSNTHFT